VSGTSAAVGCCHERGHIVDSRFHGDSYATPRSRQIFCDVCRVQRWLDIEAALALSQGDLGIIPAEAAREIAAAAKVELIDLEEVRDGIRRTGHSLVALLGCLQRACPPVCGEFVHYGATTKDIQDTAQVLEMREVLDEVQCSLQTIVGRLVELAAEHRSTLMIGRTHARPALPTSFGFKVAGWIDELLRDADRIDSMRSRLLVAQLSGGVGTMASFGQQGPELLAVFAERLSLGVPMIAWHVARDRVAEFVTALAMLVATAARVADEIRNLSRPELAELEEGWEFGKVGSSTMPHKRNPEQCERVVMLARLTKANAILGLECMIQEHERDSRGLRLEWVAVADVSHHALAALSWLTRILVGLRVHADRMADNAQQAADKICTEALMLALGSSLGKQSAHALVYELSQTAHEHSRSLRQSLAARPDIVERLPAGDLDDAFDPRSYLGEATRTTEVVLAFADRWLTEQRP